MEEIGKRNEQAAEGPTSLATNADTQPDPDLEDELFCLSFDAGRSRKSVGRSTQFQDKEVEESMS